MSFNIYASAMTLATTRLEKKKTFKYIPHIIIRGSLL